MFSCTQCSNLSVADRLQNAPISSTHRINDICGSDCGLYCAILICITVATDLIVQLQNKGWPLDTVSYRSQTVSLKRRVLSRYNPCTVTMVTQLVENALVVTQWLPWLRRFRMEEDADLYDQYEWNRDTRTQPPSPCDDECRKRNTCRLRTTEVRISRQCQTQQPTDVIAYYVAE